MRTENMSDRGTTAEPGHVTAEPTPESEPTAESEPTGRPQAEAPAEPTPEWSTATEVWGVAWELHQYGIGTAFLIVALFVLFVLFRIQLRGASSNRQKWIQMIVLSLLFVFNITRSLILFADAYHSRGVLPRALLQVLWGLAYPCIITAYALIFVILKNALMLKQKFQNWYTAKNIALVTVPYFLFALAGELTFGLTPRLKEIGFVCQLLYVTFGFLLSGFYVFIAALLWWKLGNYGNATKKNGTSQSGPEDRGRRTRSIFRICLAIAGGGFVLCCVQFYGMVGVYGALSDATYVDPWPWFAFNTVLRVLEIYLCVILYLVAMKNSGKKNKRIEVAPITVTSGHAKFAGEPKKGTKITISIDTT